MIVDESCCVWCTKFGYRSKQRMSPSPLDTKSRRKTPIWTKTTTTRMTTRWRKSHDRVSTAESPHPPLPCTRTLILSAFLPVSLCISTSSQSTYTHVLTTIYTQCNLVTHPSPPPCTLADAHYDIDVREKSPVSRSDRYAPCLRTTTTSATMRSTVDILILGAGWTSTFLIPLCEERGISQAATSRAGRDGTIAFEFDPHSTSSAPFQALPHAHTVLITFPIKVPGASARLVKLFQETHPEGPKTGFVQLGSTGIWDVSTIESLRAIV